MDFLIAAAPAGAQKTPGVIEALYCVKSDLSTIGTPPAVPTTQAEKVTISTAHVAVATEGFRKMYISTKKAEALFKGVGDEDGQSVDGELDAFIPGITPEWAAFLYDQPEMIILIPDGPCGTSRYYQLGTKCDGARVKEWEAKTGKFGSTEVKGIQVKIGAVQSSILFYTAAVPVP
jgi:hypothetical protein